MAKTTAKGILKAIGVGAVLGALLSVPLAVYKSSKAEEELCRAYDELSQVAASFTPRIAAYTVHDADGYRVERNDEGDAIAVYFKREYSLPEEYLQNIEMPELKVAAGVIDRKPFFKHNMHFGPEDSLHIIQYNEGDFSEYSFKGFRYGAKELENSEGTFEPQTIDFVIVGIMSAIKTEEENKMKQFA